MRVCGSVDCTIQYLKILIILNSFCDLNFFVSVGYNVVIVSIHNNTQNVTRFEEPLVAAPDGSPGGYAVLSNLF